MTDQKTCYAMRVKNTSQSAEIEEYFRKSTHFSFTLMLFTHKFKQNFYVWLNRGHTMFYPHGARATASKYLVYANSPQGSDKTLKTLTVRIIFMFWK